MPEQYEVRDNMGRKIGTATATGAAAGCSNVLGFLFIALFVLVLEWVALCLVLGIVVTIYKFIQSKNWGSLLYVTYTFALPGTFYLLGINGFINRPDTFYTLIFFMVIAWVLPALLHPIPKQAFQEMYKNYYYNTITIVKAPYLLIKRYLPA